MEQRRELIYSFMFMREWLIVFYYDHRMDEDFRSRHGVCIVLQDSAEGTEPVKATAFPPGFKRQS